MILKVQPETISDNWKPFENNEKRFFFMLKAFFVLKIFTFSSWLFGLVRKVLDMKAKAKVAAIDMEYFTRSKL